MTFAWLPEPVYEKCSPKSFALHSDTDPPRADPEQDAFLARFAKPKNGSSRGLLLRDWAMDICTGLCRMDLFRLVGTQEVLILWVHMDVGRNAR